MPWAWHIPLCGRQVLSSHLARFIFRIRRELPHVLGTQWTSVYCLSVCHKQPSSTSAPVTPKVRRSSHAVQDGRSAPDPVLAFGRGLLVMGNTKGADPGTSLLLPPVKLLPTSVLCFESSLVTLKTKEDTVGRCLFLGPGVVMMSTVLLTIGILTWDWPLDSPSRHKHHSL